MDNKTPHFVRIRVLRPCTDIQTPSNTDIEAVSVSVQGGRSTDIETPSCTDSETASVSVVPISRPQCVIIKCITIILQMWVPGTAFSA